MRLSGAIVPAIVIAFAPVADAGCHRFSVWHFPFKQTCASAEAVRHGGIWARAARASTRRTVGIAPAVTLHEIAPDDLEKLRDAMTRSKDLK